MYAEGCGLVVITAYDKDIQGCVLGTWRCPTRLCGDVWGG